MTCCGGDLALSIARGIPNVGIGGGLSSLGRELRRAGRRINAEANRARDKVGQVGQDVIDESRRVVRRVSAEYARFGSRVTDQVKRSTKDVAGVYSGAAGLAGDTLRKVERAVRKNPAMVAALGGLLLPFGGVWLIAGTILSGWGALVMAKGGAPFGEGEFWPGAVDFSGGGGASAAGVSGSQTGVAWGWLIAAALVLFLVVRAKR